MLTFERFGLILGAAVLAASCAVGCGSSGSGNGAVCVAQEHTIAPIDPNNGGILLRGAYVYVASRSGASSLTRVPLAGGPTETIATASVGQFAANEAGTVAWQDLTDPLALQWLGPQQESRTLTLPKGAQQVVGLAVDAGNNVFVLVNDPAGGNTIWRYSAAHQAFDQLHHNLGGLSGFYDDVDGIAWVGPLGTSSAVFHEDVTGGAPKTSAPLVPRSAGGNGGVNAYGNILGLSATTIFAAEGGTISSIDRATGVSTATFDLSTTISKSTGIRPDPYSATTDGTSFYWIERDSLQGTSSIKRTPISGTGAVETVATVGDLQSLSVGGCSLAYIGSQDSSSWGIVARPK